MSNYGRVRAAGKGIYHVILRTVGNGFFFTDEEKNIFTRILRKPARFGYIQIISHSFLDNHVHLLVYVPERQPVSDEEVIARLADLYFEEKAKRFDPALRGREMTLFDLLKGCKLRCLENSGMLASDVEEMQGIKGKHPRESIIPGYYSAYGLRKIR